MRNKFISFVTAISLVMPLALAFTTLIPATAGLAAAVSSPAPDHEVRVVGKRITGDNKYFEISLEVDRDYEEYTSVGVVLEYDPKVIVPAASWDDDAEEADMKDNVSWATRRALPTLGKDTWTTHTALAYQTSDNGYLYIGAEFPGTTPDPADPTATADPSATATPTPVPTDTPDPNVTPDPDVYVNPIVVARFMYVGDDDAAKAVTKTSLETAWTTPAPTPDGTSWDESWLGIGTTAATARNKILHIAPDDITAASAAEYGAAVYYCDFSRKVYRYAYPAAPTPTVTPTPDPSATATPQPFTAYSPAPVGSAVEASEKLNASDIEIVLGEGKSAKSGGLSLNDVFSILFFDWDDTFLGALTAGIGVDVTADVNNYVRDSFVHPDLRGENYDALATAGTLTQRKYNYRGEYPYTGPAATNPTIPDSVSDYTDKKADGTANPKAGSLFPLTNKLDYCFAGKDIDKDNPFANGWTAVVTSEMDYSDTTLYPGYKAKTMPTYMSTTFTSLENTQTYGHMPELDSAYMPVAPATASDIPDVVAFDFADIANMTKADLDTYGGNIYVKAVYTPGEMLNRTNPSNSSILANYVAIGDLNASFNSIQTTVEGTTYGVPFEYRRINKYGYGVERINESTVRMTLKQIGSSSSTPLELSVKNGDVIDVLLTPTNAVETFGYMLVDKYGKNVITGIDRSLDTELGNFKIGGPEGKGFKMKFAPYLDHAAAGDTSNWFPLTEINKFNFLKVHTGNGTAFAARTYTNARTRMNTLVANVIAAGDDYKDLTWYQIQYALTDANNGAYVSSSTAKDWCESFTALSKNAAKQ